MGDTTRWSDGDDDDFRPTPPRSTARGGLKRAAPPSAAAPPRAPRCHVSWGADAPPCGENEAPRDHAGGCVDSCALVLSPLSPHRAPLAALQPQERAAIAAWTLPPQPPDSAFLGFTAARAANSRAAPPRLPAALDADADDEGARFAALPRFTQLAAAASAGAADTPIDVDASLPAAPLNAWAAARAEAAAARRRRASAAAPDSPAATSCRLRAWLASLQLSEYAPLLTAAPGLSWRQLCHVTDDDALQALGVAALGPRLRMLASLAAFRAGLTAADTAADAAPEAAATSAAQPAAKRRAVTTLAPERSIAAYFGGGSSSAPVPRAAAPVPPRSRHGGAGSAKTAAAQPGKPRGRAAPRPRAADASAPVPLSSLPPWQRIEGAAFVIDSFGGVGRRAEPCTAHFLTHFHSDHYGGLSATWPADKPIFCTAVTARLAALRLRVPHAAFRVLPLGRRTTLAGCGVTLLEANHCPGAAMLLFEPPPPAPPTLHTGDCRWDDARMRAALEPHLAALRDRSALRLVLDTTYGCPLTRAVFPPAADAAAFVAAAVAAEAFNPRTLFLFGAYTIGKEAVFLEAARAANKLVYCGAAKRAVLDCLGLPAADLALITGDERATNLHVVPMQSVGFAAMKGVLAHYKGRFNCCVGFAPTGWSFARGQTNAAKARGAGGGLGRGCRQARGASLVRYSVPYSEHSSFFELRAALRYLRPQAICPSVANDQGPKAAAMVAALLAPADEAAE